jgi:hypothetical protein
MMTLVLSAVLFAALGLIAWAEWHSPSRHPTVRILLLGIAILALVGLLALWGLPVATDVLTR